MCNNVGMQKIIDRLAVMAKAIVAVITPIVVAAIADIAADLTVMAQGAVTAAATAVTVYLTPNKREV